MADNDTLVVVVPTRNRAEKLRRCLEALVAAREYVSFSIHVLDSSDHDVHVANRATCEQLPDVTLWSHDGDNVAQARNACVIAAKGASWLVNVDDDVYVKADAIAKLAAALRSGEGAHSVVAGSVFWDNSPSRPIKMRRVGYGRIVKNGEAPDFLIGAFFGYSSLVAEAFPWNTRIRTSDDRFMGAVWRAHGVSLRFCPDALAVHDDVKVSYGVAHQSSHIYANLFDAVFVRRSLGWALSFEILGFLWGLKAVRRSVRDAGLFLRVWGQGHALFFRDRRLLRAYVHDSQVVKDLLRDGQAVPRRTFLG